MDSKDVNKTKNKFQTNDIIYLNEICEKLFENNILKYKYVFFDILLNDWYTINKALITDKINDLENINSLFIFNCHKNLIYSIIKISKKYKMKIYLELFFLNNQNRIQKKLILIRSLIFNEFKKNINSIYIRHSFFYYLINNNIRFLSKGNSIRRNCLIIKIKNNNNIFSKINSNLYFIKWRLFINKFNNIENTIYFYLDKIKFFQITAFAHIFKRKLRYIFNLFIYKIMNEKHKYHIEKNQFKNNISIFISLNLYNNYIINDKIFFIKKIISNNYSRIKGTFFFYIFSFFINKILNKYRKKFIEKLNLFIKMKKNRYNIFFHVISNFIDIKNYKSLIFSFNALRSFQYSKLNIKYKKYNNLKINFDLLFDEKFSKILINLINIYYKYHNFNNWKNKQNQSFYFNKWKSIMKLFQYQKIIQSNNQIKKKFENYNNANIIMKNKLQILNKNNKKRKINKNIKEKIKSNIKKYEKMIISKNITKVINNDKSRDSNKSDNLRIAYLNSIKNLKNKNEAIINELQTQINDLVREIEILSSDI